MPIKSCVIDGKKGWKYGDEGTCYTGPEGKRKAIAQGIAVISSNPKELPLQELASKKISFDFDDTLSLGRWQDKALELISQGNTLYIISARDSKEGMLKIADKVGIPHSRVYATGSNKNKVEKIKSLGIETHYDNNSDVINELKSTNTKGIKV